jgi:hypothetical protein
MNEQNPDGPCWVCGKPGYIRQIPEVPVSGCYCDEDVPSGPPIVFYLSNLLFVLIFISGIGWLIYHLIFK